MSKQIWKGGTVLYPVPSVMVSCGDFEGEKNIITIGWTGIINTNPPRTYISIRPERYSYDIIMKNKEFVINLTTEDLARATDFCGVRSGRDVDKFSETGLTPMKSQNVLAPSIEESPLNMECKIFQVMNLGSHCMLMADIVSVTVEESLIDSTGKFNFNKSNPLCYSHGGYFGIGEFKGKFGFSVNKKTNAKKRKKTAQKNNKR